MCDQSDHALVSLQFEVSLTPDTENKLISGYKELFPDLDAEDIYIYDDSFHMLLCIIDTPEIHQWTILPIHMIYRQYRLKNGVIPIVIYIEYKEETLDILKSQDIKLLYEY